MKIWHATIGQENAGDITVCYSKSYSSAMKALYKWCLDNWNDVIDYIDKESNTSFENLPLNTDDQILIKSVIDFYFDNRPSDIYLYHIDEVTVID